MDIDIGEIELMRTAVHPGDALSVTVKVELKW